MNSFTVLHQIIEKNKTELTLYTYIVQSVFLCEFSTAYIRQLQPEWGVKVFLKC